VGALDLTALGIGAVIGTGIFVVNRRGHRRGGPRGDPLLHARGPDVPVLGALLRRARLVDPGVGSAYTYAYATLGELVA
jgi:APA family basic amino acid/polyamine antiporter